MLKLYGFAVSDYFNMVKHLLLHKGIEFEEVTVYPEQTAQYLSKSPMGKVPCIETEHGFLCETSVILDYLENAFPDQAMQPASTWERAKMKELMKISELYIELAARKLLPEMLAGVPVADAVKKEARETLEKGLSSVNRLASFSPFALGEQETLADIMLRYSLGVAKAAAGVVLGWDILEGQAALKAWDERMAANPICQQLDADMQAQLAAFIQKMSAK